MTKQIKTIAKCPSCGGKIECVSPMHHWINHNPNLDSIKNGLVFYDCDLICHHYKVDHNRTVQCLMIIEVKTNGSLPAKSQKDTLNILSQVIRNRRSNRNKRIRYQIENRPSRVYSTLQNKWMPIRLFGAHLLRLEKNSPLDSTWMEWDRRMKISISDLEGLLKFELDPDDPSQEYTLRIHHRKEPDLLDQLEYAS